MVPSTGEQARSEPPAPFTGPAEESKAKQVEEEGGVDGATIASNEPSASIA